jgi:hypothetical protein
MITNLASEGTFDSFLSGPAPVPVPAPRLAQHGNQARRRQITPVAGRAIEMLGHAIEYLADEYALECITGERGDNGGRHPKVVAIELLMARNREVYFSCPEVPTFAERLRALLRLQRA